MSSSLFAHQPAFIRAYYGIACAPGQSMIHANSVNCWHSAASHGQVNKLPCPTANNQLVPAGVHPWCNQVAVSAHTHNSFLSRFPRYPGFQCNFRDSTQGGPECQPQFSSPTSHTMRVPLSPCREPSQIPISASITKPPRTLAKNMEYTLQQGKAVSHQLQHSPAL